MVKSKIRQIMGRYKKAWHLAIFNWKPVLIFTALYSVILLLVNSVVAKKLLEACLYLTGLKYIGNDTIGNFVRLPFSWISLFIICFIMVYIITLGMCGNIFALHRSKTGRKTTVKELISASISAAKKLIYPKNWTMLPYMLLFVPYAGMIKLTSGSYSLSIPGFAQDFLYSRPYITILILAAYVFCVFIFLRDLLAMHSFTLKDTRFKEGRRISHVILKIKPGLTELFIQLLILNGLVVMMERPFAFTRLSSLIFNIVVLSLVPVYNTAVLSVYYYEGCEKHDIEVPDDTKLAAIHDSAYKLSIAAIIACFTAFIGWYTYDQLSKGFVSVRPEIIAHRGDSVRAPENSMAAFELAIDEEVCEWIELDVHQTSDGVIVVSHDDSLKRITGYDLYVHDLTYEELARLDTGSWFSPVYSNMHIATLDEVLEFCKNKIKVQIELKPTRYDKDLEQNVLDIIKENDMQEDCVIVSLNARALKNIKKLSPDTPTVYCLVIGVGDIAGIEFADAFSIEESYINASLVSRIHMNGKKCYAWIVNSNNRLQYLIDCGIDGILTDDPIKMSEFLDKADYSSGIIKFFRKLERARQW